jgi:glycosyltransferase involved in cell wall biosynthesis
MRVAIVIDSLTWGGAETLLADLVVALPAAGVEPSVAYLFDLDASPTAAVLRERGLEPHLIAAPRLHDPRGFTALRGWLRAARPDVVHTHLGYADLLGGPAARSLGVPAVSTLHLMRWERRGKEGAKERLMALARRRCAARVIAVSDAARAAYLETGWDRPARVVTVRNGVAREAAPGAGAAVRAELGLSPQDRVCAMVTVLRAGKGHDVAAAALAQLDDPRVKLVVCGDGPDRAAIERELAPLGDAVVMAGHRTDVMRVLDAADVLLHPTREDAFPTTLLEAAAAGVPVVATAVGGVPEIVTPDTGRLVPAPPQPADVARALGELLGDDALRARMGAAARERFAKEFTARAWAQRLRALYEEVA